MERTKLFCFFCFFSKKQDVNILWVWFKSFESGLPVYDEFSIARWAVCCFILNWGWFMLLWRIEHCSPEAVLLSRLDHKMPVVFILFAIKTSCATSQLCRGSYTGQAVYLREHQSQLKWASHTVHHNEVPTHNNGKALLELYPSALTLPLGSHSSDL